MKTADRNRKLAELKRRIKSLESEYDKLYHSYPDEFAAGYEYLNKHLSSDWEREDGEFLYTPSDNYTSINYEPSTDKWVLWLDNDRPGVLGKHSKSPKVIMKYVRENLS
jgi:hypothetical protein